MDERMRRLEMQHAINTTLSGLNGNPWLAQRVIASANEKQKKKKKLSAGLILAIVLVLAAAGALAAMLSFRQIVEDHAIPLANEHEGERFTPEDTNILVQFAEENGIVLSDKAKDQIRRTLDKGEGEFKDELIRDLARSEFGYYPSTWTLEQQKWFSDVLVAMGMLEESNSLLPEDGDITQDRAEAIAREYIRTNHNDNSDFNDSSLFRKHVMLYKGGKDEEYEVDHWVINYNPLTVTGSEYWIYLDTQGAFLGESVRRGVHEGAQWYDVVSKYSMIYKEYRTLADMPPDLLRALREDIDKCAVSYDNGYNCLIRVQFPDPPEDAITRERAISLGAAAAGIDKYDACTAVYVQSEMSTVWRLWYTASISKDEFHNYHVELDPFSGETLYMGIDENKYQLCHHLIPREVYDYVIENCIDPRESVG